MLTPQSNTKIALVNMDLYITYFVDLDIENYCELVK